MEVGKFKIKALIDSVPVEGLLPRWPTSPCVLRWQKGWGSPLGSLLKRTWIRTSLVVQWLRIYLAMQGTGSTSGPGTKIPHVATKPMCHSYWASTLELGSHNHWAHVLQLLKPVHPRAHAAQQEKLLQWEACAWLWIVPLLSELKKANM